MNRRLIFSALLMTLFLAACGNLDPPPPTLTPLPTIVVLSSPLPPIATEAPAGFDEDNPLRLLIVAADAESASEEGLIDTLTTSINANADTVVQAEVATTGEALNSLCNPNGRLVAAYVDGLTYAVANLRGCGLPVIKRVADDTSVGRASIIIASSPPAPTPDPDADEEDEEELEPEDPTLESVAEGTYCRISATDVYSWQLPAIAFQAAGVEVSDFANIQQYDTYEDLITAVESGECSGAGVPVDVWEIADVSGDILELETTEAAPYNVLVFASGGEAEIVEDVTEAIQTAYTSGDAALIRAFFGAGILEAVDTSDSDLQNITNFLADTNIDFSQLGG